MQAVKALDAVSAHQSQPVSEPGEWQQLKERQSLAVQEQEGEVNFNHDHGAAQGKSSATAVHDQHFEQSDTAVQEWWEAQKDPCIMLQ
jgi:hypothetical protein